MDTWIVSIRQWLRGLWKRLRGIFTRTGVLRNMSDSTKRIASYTYGVNPTRIEEDVIARKPSMVAQERVHFSRLYSIELRVKAVLASEGGVTSTQLPYYMAYARQVYSTQGHLKGGAQLDSAIAVVLAAWKARGLTEAHLIRIRNEVFSIAAPAAPFGYMSIEANQPLATIAINPGYDGVPVAGPQSDVLHEVDPGVQTVVVTCPGFHNWTALVTVAEGETIAINATLVATP